MQKATITMMLVPDHVCRRLTGIIDVGVGVIPRKPSAQRYDIWTMQSQYHNYQINGIMQQPE